MYNKPSERYNSYSLCGNALVLEVFGEVGKIDKMTIGGRFFTSTKCFPEKCRFHNEPVICFFDFFRNYAPLLELDELQHGWKCYQRAKKQRSDTLQSAFWNYYGGKRIKMLGRKGAVFKWV